MYKNISKFLSSHLEKFSREEIDLLMECEVRIGIDSTDWKSSTVLNNLEMFNEFCSDNGFLGTLRQIHVLEKNLIPALEPPTRLFVSGILKCYVNETKVPSLSFINKISSNYITETISKRAKEKNYVGLC